MKYQIIDHFRGSVSAYWRGRFFSNLVSRVDAYLRVGAYSREALRDLSFSMPGVWAGWNV